MPWPGLRMRRRPPAAGAGTLPWLTAWATHASPHHDNQDAVGCTQNGATLALAVADGVTLAAAGAVAAQAAVRYWLQPASDTPEWLRGADAFVQGALAAVTDEPGGCTGVAAWLSPDGSGWLTRVGDCRALHAWRQGHGWRLQALLPDQSVDDNPSHFLGCGRLGEPESVPLVLGQGELLLLCSDGLHAELPPDAISALLDLHLPAERPIYPHSLQQLLAHLLKDARDAGGEDDITALVVLRQSQHEGGDPE